MEPFLLIKALSFLLFVVLLIYFSFVLAKKRMKFKGNGLATVIQVIEHRRLDQQLTITLVAIDGDRLVLAAGPNAIAFQKLPIKDESLE